MAHLSPDTVPLNPVTEHLSLDTALLSLAMGHPSLAMGHPSLAMGHPSLDTEQGAISSTGCLQKGLLPGAYEGGRHNCRFTMMVMMHRQWPHSAVALPTIRRSTRMTPGT